MKKKYYWRGRIIAMLKNHKYNRQNNEQARGWHSEKKNRRGAPKSKTQRRSQSYHQIKTNVQIKAMLITLNKNNT
jgi:hypothetical protein